MIWREGGGPSVGVHSARGGQDYYLLMCESRARTGFCPIHRFDGMDQIPLSQSETMPAKSN